MDTQKEFEALLSSCKNSLERLVIYKVNNKADGEDILQAVYLTAFSRFGTLRCAGAGHNQARFYFPGYICNLIIIDAPSFGIDPIGMKLKI